MIIDELQIIHNFISKFLGYIIFTLCLIIGGFFRKNWRENHEKLDVQNARGIRQSGALIDIAEHSDNETKRLHGGKEPLNPIKPRIDRKLRDKDGNL